MDLYTLSWSPWDEHNTIQRSVGEIARLKCRIAAMTETDSEQDRRILTLELEIQELKLHLGCLMGHLISKGVLTKEELAKTVEAMTPKEAAPPPPEPLSPNLDPETELSVDDFGTPPEPQPPSSRKQPPTSRKELPARKRRRNW